MYEDSHFLAINDIEPETPGHLLIITKEHMKDIHEMPDWMLAKVLPLASTLAIQIKKEHNYDGMYIGTNSGLAAEIPHFHLHVIGKKKKG